MAGYIGSKAVSVNTTSATISDDLAVGDDATVAGDATVTGVITGSTLEATGDTAAGDNAAIGYTAAEGLILTGQGSTSDITLKNDADAVVFTVPTGTDDILFPDNAKVLFGAGSDLQIYHNGTDSVIQEAVSTRRFLIAGDEIVIRKGDLSEDMANFTADGAVTLYHNHAAKLATTSTGVNITGTVATGAMNVISGLASGTGIGASGANGNLRLYANGTQSVTVATSGDVTIADGNLVIGTSGHGIDFSNQAEIHGSPTNELLDHYEEGAWTPALASDATPTAYSTQIGKYTRIGSVVNAHFEVSMSTVGSFAGAVIAIVGLPFTSANNACVEIGNINVVDAASDFVEGVYLRKLNNDDGMRLEQYSGTTTSDHNVNANKIDTGTLLTGSISYLTAE